MSVFTRCCLCIFAISSLPAMAEDIFENKDYKLEPLLADKPFDLAAELGALITTGNNESTSLLWKLQAKHKLEKWRIKYSFESLFKRDEVQSDQGQYTKTSAEKYLFDAEANYKITDSESIFAYVGSDHDRFGAFRSISSAVAGYNFRAIDGSLITWDLNVAPGYTFIETREGESDSAPVLRSSSSFNWTVSSHAKLTQNLSIESSSINTRVIGQVAVIAKIHGSMLMKVGFKATFNDEVAEGRENTDTQSSVTLVVHF